MQRRWILSGLLAAGAMAAAAAACDDTTTPSGHGNTVVVDVDATSQAGLPPPSDAGADSPFARTEAGYGSPDGYNPFGTCQACTCAPTEYCFGGGTGFLASTGTCHPAAFGVGCQPLPPECPDASCACLVGVLGKQLPCYPVCVQNSRTAYCPNP